MPFNKTPTIIIAVLGLAVSGAAAFLLVPAGIWWATKNAEAQVMAARKLGDEHPVRLVSATQVPNVDPKNRSERPTFKP
jgi:hypothetical protein